MCAWESATTLLLTHISCATQALWIKVSFSTQFSPFHLFYWFLYHTFVTFLVSLPNCCTDLYFTSLRPSDPTGSAVTVRDLQDENSAQRVRGETFHLCVSTLHYLSRRSRKWYFLPINHTFSHQRLVKIKQEGGGTANVDGLWRYFRFNHSDPLKNVTPSHISVKWSFVFPGNR